MSDKNKTPEEDYLDRLLRSITGGNEVEEELLDDNFITEDMDFDKDASGGISEEDFLSDFEKEFFGGDIEESKDKSSLSTQEEMSDFSFDDEIMGDTASFFADSILEEPEINIPEPVVVTPQAMATALVSKEPVKEEVAKEEPVIAEPVVEEPTVEELVVEEPAVEEPAVEENIADSFPMADFADVINISEEQAMVDEAIASEDSSVEEDLKGLYGILGMGEEATALPDDIEDTPKKKKGLFSKKDKKEKKEKKEKKKKNKKKKDLEEEVANTIVVEGEGLEDFDFSDLSLDALGMGEPGTDSSEAAFDMSGMEANSQNGDDLGIAFDDSIFDSMVEDGGNGEPIVFDSDPFGDDAALDDEIDEEAELKAQKKKEKQEAKEKKKKEKEQAKKEKAEAKKKKAAKKTPKPKKIKEPDEVINIPIIFVVFALSFILIVVLVAKIGGDYYAYNEKFYEAVSLYVYGNDLKEGETLDKEAYESKFSDAYNLIYGLEMKEKDHKVFYEQLTTIELMDCHYQAYKSFMMMEDYAHGLDSLVKAIKMYDKYQNKARDLKCFDEMTVVLSWVDTGLNKTYGISQSEARELSMIKDDDEYAVIVREIAAKAEAEYKKNNVDEE